MQQHNLETFPHDNGMYASVRRVAFGLTVPASLIAYVFARTRGFGSEFIEFTVVHVVWALLAYGQWYAVVHAREWLRRRRGVRTVTLALALVLGAYGMGGILTGLGAANNSEHDVWWHIQFPVWSLGFAAAVVAPAGRQGDQPAT